VLHQGLIGVLAAIREAYNLHTAYRQQATRRLGSLASRLVVVERQIDGVEVEQPAICARDFLLGAISPIQE